MLKLAFFETGRRHDHVIEQFDGLEIDRVPICKVKSLNLMYYDILFIPSFSNQDILSNISERLKIFLRYGGIIIALGALQDKTQWMPYCTYNLPFLKEIEFKNIDQRQSKIVFDKLSLNQNDFRFHDVFMTHGFFKCNEDICFPLITGTDEQSLVMAILEPKGAAGKVLFTTLDPDFHAISGYQRECKEYNKSAQILLQNIIHWAKDEAIKQNRVIKWFRTFLGISKVSLVSASLIVTVGFCLSSIAAFFLGAISSDTLNILSSITTLIAFALAIQSYKMNRI